MNKPKYKHPIWSAIARAFDCPPEHPLRRTAQRMVLAALRRDTKREAAAILGIHEVRLSELLREHPELK